MQETFHNISLHTIYYQCLLDSTIQFRKVRKTVKTAAVVLPHPGAPV